MFNWWGTFSDSWFSTVMLVYQSVLLQKTPSDIFTSIVFFKQIFPSLEEWVHKKSLVHSLLDQPHTQVHSMYGIFTYIYHKTWPFTQVNNGKYTIVPLSIWVSSEHLMTVVVFSDGCSKRPSLWDIALRCGAFSRWTGAWYCYTHGWFFVKGLKPRISWCFFVV